MGKDLSLRRPSDIFAGFDNYFNKVFSDMFGEEFEAGFKGYPRVDIYDNHSVLIIEASVPGLSKDNVRVDWQNGGLTICGKSATDESRSSNNYLHKELHRSTFCRSFKVDEHKFDIEKIDAKVENGLLTVTIPRKDVSKFETKRITIK
jgi:HSP20 family protein